MRNREPAYTARLDDLLLRLEGYKPPPHVLESLRRLCVAVEDEYQNAYQACRKRAWRKSGQAAESPGDAEGQ